MRLHPSTIARLAKVSRQRIPAGSANRRAWWEIRSALSRAIDTPATEDEIRIRAVQIGDPLSVAETIIGSR